MQNNKKTQDDVQWKNLLVGLLGFMVLAVAMGFALLQWRDNSPKPMRVSIQLNNQCGLIDDAFIVASTDGASAEFIKGVATLSTMNNQRVFLKSSPKYPAFGFESPPVKVQSSMTLDAQCSSTDRTIEAMREQFQRKK
jgi:hypothetical protein